MRSLLSLAEPIRHLTSRLPANRAVSRLLLAGAFIVALLFVVYIQQPESICTPGSALCFSSSEDVASQDLSTSSASTSESRPTSIEAVSVQPETTKPATPASSSSNAPPAPSPTSSEGQSSVESKWQKAISDAGLDFDPTDISVDKERCYDAFPKIIDDVKRPWNRFKDLRIIDDEVYGIDIIPGRMRISIVEKKILIHEANLPSIKMRADAVATLQSLHDSLVSTDEIFNPIDLVMDVKTKVPDNTLPVWSFTRKNSDNRAWIMPASNFLFDFNPDTASSSYMRAVEDAVSAARIVVQSESTTRTREFIPQPQLDKIGSTREQLIASIQTYERSVEWKDKGSKVVSSWPAGKPPNGMNAMRHRLDDNVFGEEWCVHIDPTDKSSGIQGYGEGIDMEGNPGKALCGHKYIVWDEEFGTSYVDSVALCGSVTFKLKSPWATLYSKLEVADGDFNANSIKRYKPSEDPVLGRWNDGKHKDKMKNHNQVYLRNDMHDIKYKVAAVEKRPDYAESMSLNQAKTYRERYLTRAASACYWRTLVRAYGDVYTSIKYDKVT